MKKWIASLLTLMMICLSAAAFAESERAPRTITVSGTATVVTDADTVTLSLGVSSVAKEAGEASQLNAAEVDRLIAALRAAGIEEKDITTDYYYVNTRRDYSAMTEAGDYPVIGYEVNNNLRVLVREIDQAGAMIDVALAKGATSCDGVSFSTTKAAEARDQALSAAIQEGKRKAAIAAEAAGGTLGDIINLEETYAPGGAIVNSRKAVAAAAEMDVAAGTSILADGLSFTATVQLTFTLE